MANAVNPLLNDAVDLHAPINHCRNPASDRCWSLEISAEIRRRRISESGRDPTNTAEVRPDLAGIWPNRPDLARFRPYSRSPAVLGHIPAGSGRNPAVLGQIPANWPKSGNGHRMFLDFGHFHRNSANPDYDETIQIPGFIP
jgi:hypothetical protein